MGGRVHQRVTSPQGVVEAKVTWGDKGREGRGGSKNWNFGVTSFMDGP